MSYLVIAGKFEKDINRGVWSHRSKRLDRLVEAIATCIASSRSHRSLMNVGYRLNEWRRRDPKEYSHRGYATGPILEQELTALLGYKVYGYGPIPVVDPNAHPIYEPARWNLKAIQESTNCYAYACDDPDNHPPGYKPQPGQIGGIDPSNLVVEGHGIRYAVMQDDLSRNVQRAARLTPLVRLCDAPIPDDVVNVPGFYLIALFTAPGVDYHWVRQDRNGMWSHKPGHSPATNLDSAGDPIEDPRNCVMTIVRWGVRVAYEFTTFYYAPRGGVRTGALGNASPPPASILPVRV